MIAKRPGTGALITSAKIARHLTATAYLPPAKDQLFKNIFRGLERPTLIDETETARAST